MEQPSWPLRPPTGTRERERRAYTGPGGDKGQTRRRARSPGRERGSRRGRRSYAAAARAIRSRTRLSRPHLAQSTQTGTRASTRADAWESGPVETSLASATTPATPPRIDGAPTVGGELGRSISGRIDRRVPASFRRRYRGPPADGRACSRRPPRRGGEGAREGRDHVVDQPVADHDSRIPAGKSSTAPVHRMGVEGPTSRKKHQRGIAG